jgi:CheY-like chemotaxis protein
MVDDDEDDRFLLKMAWERNRIGNDLRFAEDGEDAMDYLHQRGKYADVNRAPRPGLILLDLNMPKKNGREVLKEIKSDASLCGIPVVILTSSSQSEKEGLCTGEFRADSCISKPVTFDALLQIVRDVGKCWLLVTDLPDGTRRVS